VQVEVPPVAEKLRTTTSVRSISAVTSSTTSPSAGDKVGKGRGGKGKLVTSTIRSTTAEPPNKDAREEAPDVGDSTAAPTTGGTSSTTTTTTTITTTSTTTSTEPPQLNLPPKVDDMVTDSDTWGKIFIWTQNVNVAGPGLSYFHCLKRHGDYLSWQAPNYRSLDDEGLPSNQPCSAFYIYKFRQDTSDPSAVNENRICTSDDWCISGSSLRNPEKLGHGALHPRQSAELAVRFDASEHHDGTVTAFLNTNAEGYPRNADDWTCIRKLFSYGPYSLEGAEDEAKILGLTADPNDCAALFVGWVE